MSSFLYKLRKALKPTADAYLGGVDKRMAWDKSAADADYRNQMAGLAKTKNAAEMLDSGLAADETGNVIVDPGFLDANNPSYKRAQRVAELKAQSSGARGSATLTAKQLKGLQDGTLATDSPDLPVPSGYANYIPKTKEPNATMTYRQVYAAQGRPLPADLAGQADQPYPKDYLSIVKPGSEQEAKTILADDFFAGIGQPVPEQLKGKPLPTSVVSSFKPPAARDDNTILADDAYALKGQPVPAQLKGKRIPVGALSATRPQATSSAPASPDQQRIYEQEFGLPPGGASGLTAGQVMSGLSQGRTQKNIADRQNKSLEGMNERQARALEANLANQGRQQRNADRSYGLSAAQYEAAERERQRKASEVPQSVVDRVTKNEDFVSALKEVRDAVNSGKLKVGGAMGTAKQFGLGSGSVGAPVGEMAGISPEEAAILTKWNQAVIDQVIANAASTFSDRYIQTQKGALPSLGSSKASFLRSMNDLIAKEEKFRSNLVGNTLKSKSGRANELAGTPSPSASGKSVSKKLYSASRNQTKIVYSDGSEEIVSGKK
jgi:hypothetical protein